MTKEQVLLRLRWAVGIFIVIVAILAYSSHVNPSLAFVIVIGLAVLWCMIPGSM